MHTIIFIVMMECTRLLSQQFSEMLFQANFGSSTAHLVLVVVLHYIYITNRYTKLVHLTV